MGFKMGLKMYCLVVAVLGAALLEITAASFLSEVIQHEKQGRSVGRLEGKEVYEYEGHMYSFHLDPLTWDEALEACKLEGGYLAVLEDIQEVDFVANAMDGNLCSFTAFQNVWIGGRFENKTKRWIWRPTGNEIKGKIGDEMYPPWKVNLRPGYECLNLDQDLTHKPKFTDLECFRRRRYLCEEGCSMLYDGDQDQGYWDPPVCTEEAQHTGSECTYQCNPGYEMVGTPTIQCTEHGWNSESGLNKLPACKNGNDMGQDIIDQINKTITGKDVQFLFIVDDSSEFVDDKTHNYQLNFTQAIVRAFPLSENRTAGLTTYSKDAVKHIPISTQSSCIFIRKSYLVTREGDAENDRLEALQASVDDTTTNAAHNTTIIFLFAASRNNAIDASAVADQLKAAGNYIFSISIDESDVTEMKELSSGDGFVLRASDRETLNMANRYITKEFGDNLQEDCSIILCDNLENGENGHWEPATCNQVNLENGVCHLKCDPTYSVHGPSSVTCKEDGWMGPAGPVKEQPSCYSSEDVGEDFGDEVNRTLSKYVNASFLFILDESGSVSTENFQIELDFVKIIASAFQLSPTRRAGLITFSDTANPDIPLTADDTCTFNRKVDMIKYSGGGTDIAKALTEGNTEMIRNNPDELTIVFLLTDGASSTNPAAAAQVIKDKGNLLFTVGIGNFDENQLIPISTVSDTGNPHFFGVRSFEVFQEVAEYLNTTYVGGDAEDCSIVCKQLSNSDRGSWSPAECATANGNQGQSCSLVCNPEYELRGSNPLICGPNGWTGTGGDFNIPECRTPDELGGDFVDKIEGTLAGEIASNLLFVVDESGSVSLENFNMELDFIRAVVQAFPLSVNRSAGLITFDSDAATDIPVSTADHCGFLDAMKGIQYSGGGTDILKALQAASTELNNAGHNQTIIFLITDGESSTDPKPAADTLKADGVIIFAVGVAGYNQAQLEPLTSIGPDGTTNFFGIKSFEIFQVIADYLNSTSSEDAVTCPGAYQGVEQTVLY